MRQVTVSAPGKLILLGEYAVLEGAPALVAAVDRRARIRISSNDSSNHHFSSPTYNLNRIPFLITEKGSLSYLSDLSEETQNKMMFVQDLLIYLFGKTGPLKTGISAVDITADTSPFYHDSKTKFGFGSSAALTVAFVAGFAEYSRNDTGMSIANDDIFQLAIRAHRAAQGSMGSGIDIAASTFGNLLRYRLTPGETHRWEYDNIEHFPDELHMLPIWTNISASTPHLLKNLNQFKETEFGSYENLMGELSLLSDDGIEAFVTSEVPEFLEIIELYYQVLIELGDATGISIVSKTHRKIHDIVSSAGGVYKPSGAGLGDMGIAFTDDGNVGDRITNEIAQYGYELIPLSIAKTGVEITTQSE